MIPRAHVGDHGSLLASGATQVVEHATRLDRAQLELAVEAIGTRQKENPDMTKQSEAVTGLAVTEAISNKETLAL
jgi:hypothetical protein